MEIQIGRTHTTRKWKDFSEKEKGHLEARRANIHTKEIYGKKVMVSRKDSTLMHGWYEYFVYLDDKNDGWYVPEFVFKENLIAKLDKVLK
jgi:hypothetical protein